MVDESTIETVRKCLRALDAAGIHARRAVLFGSFARGEQKRWSDIDLVVIAPEFDSIRELALIEKLWRTVARVDNRVEPVPCGEKEWDAESGRPIIDIARREGRMIALAT